MARWWAASSPCHGSLGRNLLVEWRFADGDVNRLPALVGELVQARVDLRRRRCRRPGAPAIRAAKQATTTIPIVMFGNFDPIALGTVSDLAGLAATSPAS